MLSTGTLIAANCRNVQPTEKVLDAVSYSSLAFSALAPSIGLVRILLGVVQVSSAIIYALGQIYSYANNENISIYCAIDKISNLEGKQKELLITQKVLCHGLANLVRGLANTFFMGNLFCLMYDVFIGKVFVYKNDGSAHQFVDHFQGIQNLRKDVRRSIVGKWEVSSHIRQHIAFSIADSCEIYTSEVSSAAKAAFRFILRPFSS